MKNIIFILILNFASITICYGKDIYAIKIEPFLMRSDEVFIEFEDGSRYDIPKDSYILSYQYYNIFTHTNNITWQRSLNFGYIYKGDKMKLLQVNANSYFLINGRQVASSHLFHKINPGTSKVFSKMFPDDTAAMWYKYKITNKYSSKEYDSYFEDFTSAEYLALSSDNLEHDFKIYKYNLTQKPVTSIQGILYHDINPIYKHANYDYSRYTVVYATETYDGIKLTHENKHLYELDEYTKCIVPLGGIIEQFFTIGTNFNEYWDTFGITPNETLKEILE